MDTKQLFRLYQSKFYLTNWLNEHGELAQNEGEVKWHYCGIKDEYKSDVVSAAINNTFQEDEVYLCISSNSSFLVPKSTTAKEIGSFLHKKEIGVMNKSFTKMIEFATYGVFKIGRIREFPKNRVKPKEKPLKVAFHANIVDKNTEKISEVIRSRLENLEKELNNDYEGSMEHLWIDLELVESHLTNRAAYPFRFQKRVSIPTSYTEFYSYNVGHYSVKPDFGKLRELLSEESICSYVSELLYESTQILIDKQKTLGNFNTTAFRADFLSACEKLDYYKII